MSEGLLDAEFVADARSTVDSRPLTGQWEISLPGENAARLVRLAEEALRLRAKLAAGPPVGPRGLLVKLDSQDGRGRMTALIEFDDEDELRRAGAWLAAGGVIERAPPLLEAANEGGNRQAAIGTMSSLWTRDLFVDDDESVGLQISHLAQALTTWAMMRGQAGANPTIAEAMLTFNTTQDVIEEAIREGRWLYTIEKGGDPLKTEICVDGE